MRAAAAGRSEQLDVLVVFAGADDNDQTLPAQLREAGHRVLAIDTRIGGASHDVLRHDVQQALLHRVRARRFHAVFLAPPCSSYSVALDPQLRSTASPEGVVPLPPGWESYVAKHNRLTRFTMQLFAAAATAGIPVAMENPAPRDDETSPAYWPAFADRGSIWHVQCVREALAAARARTFLFSQCAFGADTQKYTVLAAAGDMADALEGLQHNRCTHAGGRHRDVARGRDEQGRSRSARAAAYPPAMNRYLVGAIERAAAARQRRIEAALEEAGGSGEQEGAAPAAAPRDEGAAWAALPTLDGEAGGACEGEAVVEGRVADGAGLGPVALSAIEAARTAPTPFASMRHRQDASAASLRSEAMPCRGEARPTDRRQTAVRRRALRRAHRAERKWQEGSSTAKAAEVAATPADEAAAGTAMLQPPAGPIPIASLFLPGVYETQVASWLQLADEAAADLRAGREARHVPTRVIGQEQMQPWARGVVWDCRDPERCVPVQRSTRDTPVAGRRQVNRRRVREVAEQLGWHDTDLIDQIGEGGVEVRSACELLTVLAFHHDSLSDELEAAQRVVDAHLSEGWVRPPTRHLPFVPCRLQPRGVIMQSRTRLAEDGVRLEEYLKPRVTTDSSFGGIDSVNAGVSASQRATALPSAQALARAWAICETAFPEAAGAGAGGARIRGYAIDAESAYSFCPVQQADLWTQTFVWWDDAGRAGFAVDERMGFGGAFAPNRFQRTSEFVVAYARALQAEFDRQHPMPPSAQRWRHDREQLQQAGGLPQAADQGSPTFLQSYIDDLTGCCPDDIVGVPDWLSHIQLPEEQMRAAGCTPAPADSRVAVHARIAIWALQDLGFAAAEQKTMCGAPLPVLGLRIDGEHRRLDCPEGKRQVILADVREQREMALQEAAVDRRRATRLVGRLCNLSQVAPQLRSALHGGYGVIRASWVTGGHRRAPRQLQLSPGGAAATDWIELLDLAEQLIEANEGVSTAPALTFPGRDVIGSLTVITDASGEDGVGGYAFLAGRDDEVWIMSEAWPEEVATALAAAADEGEAERRRQGDATARPMLSMPAAELFGTVAMAAAVAAGERVDRVVAVSDCEPAARATDAQHSGNPQMRVLLAAARRVSSMWLGAHVPREANLDADRLSHPEQAAQVVAEAEAVGLTVHRVRPDWNLVTSAIEEGARRSVGRRRRKRRQRRPE